MIRISLTHSATANAVAKSAVPGEIWLTSDFQELAFFWPRTDRLGEARCHAFQCADLLEVWCSTIASARRTHCLFTAIVNGDGDPLMLLALGIERRHSLRILGFLDGGMCDYGAPIVFPGVQQWDASTVETLWQHLRQIIPPFDIAILKKMPADIGDLRNPLLLLGTTPCPTSCHAVTLTGTWDEFAANRLPRRQDSRRRRRQLTQRGRLSFEIATTPDQRENALRTLMRQKGSWYVNRFGINLFNRPGVRAYLGAATSRLPSPRPLHISTLKLDDRIISVHWGYVVGRRFYQFLPSYEADMHRHGPGRLLHEHLIEWSFAHRLDFFDFGIGDEQYKNEYCDVTVALYRVARPITFKGLLYIWLVALRARTRTTTIWSIMRRFVKAPLNALRRSARDN
jgi:CelD/BcsL family acetyltransferase involved in cellulose biosynthesis